MRISDWSSDVRSSDLRTGVSPRAAIGRSARFAERHRLELPWEGGLEADRARAREGLARLQDIARRLGIERSQIGQQGVHDRKSVVKGKNGSVRVDIGGWRDIKNKINNIKSHPH